MLRNGIAPEMKVAGRKAPSGGETGLWDGNYWVGQCYEWSSGWADDYFDSNKDARRTSRIPSVFSVHMMIRLANSRESEILTRYRILLNI